VRRYKGDQAVKGQTCDVNDMVEDGWSEAAERRHGANTAATGVFFSVLHLAASG
jgi:hypothetical protein